MTQSGIPFAAKRLIDLVVGGLAVMMTAPLMLVIAAAIALGDGPPVLFRQVRSGRHLRPFTLIKFRTLKGHSSDVVDPDSDSRRITRFGRFLRAASLDELPQLINVLRGEMSLVGPRPLITQYGPRYSREQARRHEVLPGITGWAQINGRNSITWERRFELDVWYVDNWSLLLDLRILAKTVRGVLQREGITSSNHATMPEFMGTGSKGD